MKKKAPNNPWALYNFTKQEWSIVKVTWGSLVSNDKVVLGDSNHTIANLQTLIKELK